MTEKTEENINSALEWVGKAASEGKDFILEQAPLYAQEVVAYHFWSHAILATMQILGLIIVIGGFLLSLKDGCKNGFLKENLEVPRPALIICAILGVALIPTICLSNPVEHVNEAIKAKVAPRVVVIEHLRGE